MVAIVIVLFLVGYVVPQVASVFAGTKRALPFLTVMMLTISSIVRNYGWWMLIALILIAASACWALTLESFRQKFDAAWLNLPLVGNWHAATTPPVLQAPWPCWRARACHSEGTAGGGRNPQQPRHAGRRARCAGAGARRCTAGLGPAQKKRFPGLVSMFARLVNKPGSCR